MNVLAVNAGSSSLKLRLLDRSGALLASEDLPAEYGHVDKRQIAEALDTLPVPDAIGHRIVHGGTTHTVALRLDSALADDLRSLAPLAPLQQPAALAAHDAVRAILPNVPAVACFDTAFHATLPPAAATYALPRAWREHWPLRRFGFHGLSHAYTARRSAELVDRAPEQLCIVSCHLGAGASLCAIDSGISVDTTMGFTPTEGLVMATRSGSVDPGLLLWLLDEQRLDLSSVTYGLTHDSGLRGLAGTGDMREVLALAARGDADGTLALEVYLHRLKAAIAAMAVALGRLDALVFTGGVGEHAAEIRARTAAGLASLGVTIDGARNELASGDAEIGTTGAPVRTLVVTAREDVEIARQVRAVLDPQRAAAETRTRKAAPRLTNPDGL